MRLLTKRAVSVAVKVDWIEEDSEIEEHHRRVIELARQSLEPASVAIKFLRNLVIVIGSVSLLRVGRFNRNAR